MLGTFLSDSEAAGLLQSGLQGGGAGTDLRPAAGPQTFLRQLSQGEKRPRS